MKNLSWDSSRTIALRVNEKFPLTDVLSLRDDKLFEMVKSIEEFLHLPEIERQDRSDCLFCIKVALLRIIEDAEDYKPNFSDVFYESLE